MTSCLVLHGLFGRSSLTLMVLTAVCCLAVFSTNISAQCNVCAGGGSHDVGCACSADCEESNCQRGLLGKRQSGCRLCGCQGDGTYRGMPAPSYPVPFATPRNVTHTTFTYPPMMPHHSLPHHAAVYSFRHGCGTSRTNVHWRSPKLLNALHYLNHLKTIPR